MNSDESIAVCFYLQIMLIQACQYGDKSLVPHATGGGTPEPDPAPTQLSDPHRDQHITLTRPHTVLLLATVRGSTAYRGVFTGAMADQFRSAGSRRDLYAMFTSAASEVTTALPNQQPQVTSTTTKTLRLPPANQ